MHDQYGECDDCGSANKNHGPGLSRADHKFVPKPAAVKTGTAPKPSGWTLDRHYREEQDRAEARNLMRATEFRP